jgi:hypothetical protein
MKDNDLLLLFLATNEQLVIEWLIDHFNLWRQDETNLPNRIISVSSLTDVEHLTNTEQLSVSFLKALRKGKHL